jgi:hypothetical protein
VPGAPTAPCAEKKHTGRSRRFTGITRHSRTRMVLTAYGALSPATSSSCHRRRRIEGLAEPGWADTTSADLTPATGARTTRFCRPHQHRSSARRLIAHRLKARPAIPFAPDAAASTASHPTSVTIAIRPSLRDETAEFVALIWVRREAECFFGYDWTGQIALNLLRKIVHSDSGFWPSIIPAHPRLNGNSRAKDSLCPGRAGSPGSVAHLDGRRVHLTNDR